MFDKTVLPFTTLVIVCFLGLLSVLCEEGARVVEDRDEEVEDEFDHVLPVLEGSEDVEDGEIELELPRADVLRELELPVLLAPLALLD